MSEPNSYPPWAPRFWNGMSVPGYFSLLAENRFRIHPTRWPMTGLAGFCALFNSVFAGAQSVIHGRRIAKTELNGPPIFIIGHWRSGTTLMHELLSLDSRLAFPGNFDAFSPQHMLVTRPVFLPVMNLLMPSRRPMDNMSLDARSPQEDDFALLSLGAPTPYRRIAFPNNGGFDHDLLDGRNLSSKQADELKKSLDYFLRVLTIQHEKRLVLKSPPHTGRLAQLAEWYPDAKFVHMSRNPEKLVPSTIRLWKLLDKFQAFQVARYDDEQLRNYVFDCERLMYDAYFAAREALPKERLVEVKCEQLVAQPVAEVEKIYDALRLGDSSDVRPAVESYFGDREYRPNQHSVDGSDSAAIREHWARYNEAFGY